MISFSEQIHTNLKQYIYLILHNKKNIKEEEIEDTEG
jgi:hypothetical protein